MFQQYFGTNEINKVGFEDILYSFKNNHIILINTLPISEQSVLIKGTVLYNLEAELINDLLRNGNDLEYKIIIYGRNSCDKSVETKYRQLQKLYPDNNLYVYSGGLFEWTLLKDVYGATFETTTDEKDILMFKPESVLK